MQVLGALDKKPSMKEISDTLKTFESFNILNKIEGKWDAPDTRFVILPSILFILPNDKISMLSEVVSSKENESQDLEASSEIDEESEIMEDLL
jgi:hypothetical protein